MWIVRLCTDYLNTSHVILYQVQTPEESTSIKFKYISCYSLSVRSLPGGDRNERFKYISCYSLSSQTLKAVEIPL